MKHIIMIMVIVATLSFTGCTVNNYTILPTQPESNTGAGTESFSMAMSLKPAIDSGYTITRVAVKIANGTYTDSMDLTIFGDSAKGTFTELAPGTYTITVKAYQSTMLVAQGTGSGVVVAGQVNQAYIHLQFVTTNGDLEIIVDWGTGGGTTGLVAYYPFTGNANDASGNGHHGVVVGATLTSDRFGSTNSAYLFNGTSNIITLCPADQLSLYNQDFTVSAWFNGNSFTNRDATLLGNDYGTTSSQLALMIRYNKPLMAFIWNDTYGKSLIQENTWYHIVFRYKKSTGEHGIFVNGVQDTLSTGHSAFVGTDTVRVGRWNRGSSAVGSTYFKGVIDDIKIYNKTLSLAEIQALYHEGGWQ